MYYKKFFATLFAALFIFSAAAVAQDVTYTLSQINQFKIDGDSNVRSWDADIKNAEAALVLTNVDNLSSDALTPDSFKSLNISIAVANIESDTGRLTSNMHGYLKKDDHPHITFNLNQINSVKHEGEKAVITASGIINAAGVDNEVTMTVDAVVNGDGSIRFSGTQDLLMTSFNIDPPTAIMGTVRAADEMQILFDITFSN